MMSFGPGYESIYSAIRGMSSSSAVHPKHISCPTSKSTSSLAGDYCCSRFSHIKGHKCLANNFITPRGARFRS